MTGEELKVIRLRNDFYRDGFRKIVFSLGLIILAILSIIATSIYLYVTKPAPVAFKTLDNWRIIAPVPPQQMYLNEAEVRQWISNTLQTIFIYDFYHYDQQFEQYKKYFSENGWDIYKDFLNNYAAKTNITSNKLFSRVTALEAPRITDSGPLPDGRYAWWIEMKIKISYVSPDKVYPSLEPLIRVLVARISTAENLSGVVIENILLANPRRGA